MARVVVAGILLAACVAPPSETAETAEAPLVGVDGSHDAADRNCNVVLRGLERNWTGFSYETVGASWVWQGDVEISEAALAEGLVPHAIYQAGADPTWRSVDATPIEAAPTPGYARYTVRIFDGLPGPNTDPSVLAATTIQVVPYLAMPEGGRMFDHNRNTRDLDNYAFGSPDFAVWHAPGVCTPPSGPQRATLVFAADFSEHREGVFAPGGEITISYDTNRLTQCRNSQAGHPLWDISAHVKFAPGGERRDISVRDTAPTIAVPPTARSVELWFENTSSSGCQAWDSNFGANYKFDALVPPQWIGNVRTLIARDAGDPCDGGTGASSGFHFDTWARQRAGITNLCFEVYQPGMTDRDDPDLWQKLDVQLGWRIAGQTAFQTRHVDFDRRVGNNARYKLSWRDHDPFRAFHCPEVAPHTSSDGQYAELQLEYVVSVNGGEVRPEPGAAFGGTFSDYLHDPWRDANCH
jgi:uncharacterized protein DUF6209